MILYIQQIFMLYKYIIVLQFKHVVLKSMNRIFELLYKFHFYAKQVSRVYSSISQ